MEDVLKINGTELVRCLDKNVESVTIPNYVTKIDIKAFRRCASLKSIVIPSSVSEIGEFVFKDCNINSLSHPLLTIKGGLAIEDNRVLYCASQNPSIAVPEGVSEIGKYAFHNCKYLKLVVIPLSVTKIEYCAFSGCTSLESVVIPSSVTEIEIMAFMNCTSLSSVEFGGTATQWKAVKKGASWKHGIPATCVKCTDGEAEL